MAEIHVRVDELWHIDHACLNLLESWEKLHAGTGGQAVIPWERLQNLADCKVAMSALHDEPAPRAAA